MKNPMAQRFRSFLPVVIDIETGGFDASRDAVLEIAAVFLYLDNHGVMKVGDSEHCHVEPFAGSNIEPASLAITGINIHSPLRLAKPERAALKQIFDATRAQVKAQDCSRAILVGHNAFFDMNFLQSAVARSAIKRNPFHPFSSFDTVSLAGMAYGQTVLARACEAANIEWDNKQAHSALYDAKQTAKLFCKIINQWDDKNPERRLALFCDR